MAVTLFSDQKIDVVSFNDNAYMIDNSTLWVATAQKTVIIITRRHNTITNITINGVTYYFNNGNSVRLDYSDIVRNITSPMTFTFGYTYNGTRTEFPLVFNKMTGRMAANLEKMYPPKRIPYMNGLCLCIPIIAAGGDYNTTVEIHSHSGGSSRIQTYTLTDIVRCGQYTETITNLYYFDHIKISRNELGVYYSQFYRINDCGKRYVFLTWDSFVCHNPFGRLRKSWVFEVESIENEVTDAVNLQTYTNGYLFLTNKEIKIKIIQRNCDTTMASYLSDIIFSDTVSLQFSENRKLTYNCQPETDSLEYLQNRQSQDFELTLNLQKYNNI